jgi:carboxyl-terminal processing protease
MIARVLGSLLALFLAPCAAASAAAENGPRLAPAAEHAQAALWASRFFSRFHYAARPLDDAMSERILERYLQSLDGERLFFTQEDLASFERWRHALDDAIRGQDLSPAFEIYERYLARVRERTAFARAFLGGEIPLDRDESYRVARAKAPWAKDEEALDELWRRRVTNDVIRLLLAGRELSDAKKTLDRRYLSFEKRILELKADDVFQVFLNAYAAAMDPHTGYMGPRASENFQISMRLSLEGIGAVLQRQEEYTVVRSVVAGGPAAVSGQIRPGDRIVGVAQGDDGPMQDVVGWRLDDVVDLIRGPKGTVVRLDILPADAGPDGPHRIVRLVRDRVKLEDQAAKRAIIELPGEQSPRRVGVIALPAFYQDFEARRNGDPDYRSTTRDVARLLRELSAEGVDGIVLDLRDNGGGSLNEATELTGLFVEKGPVVQVRNAHGRIDIEQIPENQSVYRGPLAILVNRASASASEIVAAALQDYGRALIIGEPTYGKGTVQNLIDLDRIVNNERPKLGQLRLTVAQFYRISGGSTQNRGVEPDIGFPITLDPTEFGESALDNALPYNTIDPVAYQRFGEPERIEDRLRRQHERRVAEDLEFRLLREEQEEYRALRRQEEVSLNLEKRRAERDAQQARREARRQARIAAGLIQASEDESPVDDGLLADERPVPTTDEEESPEQLLTRDPLLREAARILLDAVDLLRQDPALAEALPFELPGKAEKGELAVAKEQP